MEDLYYSDYIELDKILDSQHPRSFETLDEGNDEMLFIIIHQVYELWFKQILFELDLVRHIFERFIQLGSVTLVVRELQAESRLTKRGKPFDEGLVYKLINGSMPSRQCTGHELSRRA